MELTGFLKHKWVHRLATWVLTPVVLIYGWFQYQYPTCTFRYKLTAEVMTPDGLKTGASVIEVSLTSFDVFGLVNRQAGDTVTGEAVYVDLGGGKNLFVLLGVDRWARRASRTPLHQPEFDGVEGDQDRLTEEQLGEGSLNALWLPVHVFKLGRSVGKERDMQRRANALFGQAPVEVPLINVPMLGTFADLSKPQTFNTLLPTEINKVLGEGFQLKSVKMQIVENGVGEQIKAVLPWLPSNSTESILVNCHGKVISDAEGPCRAHSGSFKLLNFQHIGMI